MKLIDKDEYRVEREVLLDAVNFEGGEWVCNTDRAAAVKVNGMHKCVLADYSEFDGIVPSLAGVGGVCALGAPIDLPKRLGVVAAPCKTYAYLQPMPPVCDLPSGVAIKRLAPSLAEFVAESYHNPYGGYTAEETGKLMREKGVFGAIADGRLAGFIGRHFDGNMGMLEVFEPFRRRGIGAALERFLITYIMTFSRTPIGDVYADNVGSLALQRKIGMTEAKAYTFWFDLQTRACPEE